MITFSPINQSYTLQLHSLKQHSVYLHNQSQYKLLHQVLTMPSVFIHTGLKSLQPFVNSVIHNALRQAMPCVGQVQSSQIGHISNWRLIHTSLRRAPYSTFKRTTDQDYSEARSPDE